MNYDNKDIILKIDFVCNVIRTAKICYFFTYIFFLIHYSLVVYASSFFSLLYMINVLLPNWSFLESEAL